MFVPFLQVLPLAVGGSRGAGRECLGRFRDAHGDYGGAGRPHGGYLDIVGTSGSKTTVSAV